MNLFSELINLGPEDISTALLSYILKDRNRFSSFQKLFFNKTIEQIRNTLDLGADILAQKEYSGGVPDITIITTDFLLLIENKLISSLSSDDQLIRYVKIFDDVLNKEKIEAQQRLLVLLCPSNLMERIRIISDTECMRLYETSFSDHCIKSNVIFRCISWEDVISDLDKSDNIQSELYNYISEYLEEVITMDELDAIKNKHVASALQKIYQKVYHMSTLVKADHFKKVGRIGQSYQQYGFTLDNDKIKIWVGFWLDAWASIHEPVGAYIDAEKYSKYKSQLEDIGFEDKGEWGYVISFSTDDIYKWVDSMNDILSKLEGKIK